MIVKSSLQNTLICVLLISLSSVSAVSAQGPSTDSLKHTMNLNDYGIVPISCKALSFSPVFSANATDRKGFPSSYYDGSSYTYVSGTNGISAGLSYDRSWLRVDPKWEINTLSWGSLDLSYHPSHNSTSSSSGSVDTSFDKNLYLPVQFSWSINDRTYLNPSNFLESYLQFGDGYSGALSYYNSNRRSFTVYNSPSGNPSKYYSSRQDKIKDLDLPLTAMFYAYPLGHGRIVNVTAPIIASQLLALAEGDGVSIKDITPAQFKDWAILLDSLHSSRTLDFRISRADDIQCLMSRCPSFDSSAMKSPRSIIHLLDVWEYAWTQKRERGFRIAFGSEIDGKCNVTEHVIDSAGVFVDYSDSSVVSADQLMKTNIPKDQLVHNSSGPTFLFSMPFTGLCGYISARKPLKDWGQFNLDINSKFGCDTAGAYTGNISLLGNLIWYPTYRSTLSATLNSDYSKYYLSEKRINNDSFSASLSANLSYYMSPSLRINARLNGSFTDAVVHSPLETRDPFFNCSMNFGITWFRF